jgi:cell volume regulation protein A
VQEPLSTAVLLAAVGTLLLISVLFSRALERFSVPIALIFLVIGMLAGSEGIGRIPFEDYQLAFRLGTVALVLILFDAGLNTPTRVIRQYVAPAGVLATIGVVGTAALVAVAALALGFSPGQALLLGAVVSSTDAAAVFAVLRGSRLHLTRRVGATLELESGTNDPMAVILTTVITDQLVTRQESVGLGPFAAILLQIVAGAVAGGLVGLLGRGLLNRIRLPSGGLYSALMLGFALLAFGLPTLLNGSGFLSVYVAAVLLGNAPMPYRAGLLRVHDALAWLAQISMFLMLGLLVFPSRLVGVAWTGLLLAMFLAFVARPAVVTLLLLPFRYPRREITYIAWVGLRGAVPIILATIPILAGAPGATTLFDIVFFIVVVNAIVPGATVAWLTRRLGLQSHEPPAPPAVLEIESRTQLKGELLSFYIEEGLAVTGLALSQIPFPDGAAATLIIRGDEMIPPRGASVLQPGDHVYVIVRPEDRPLILLMFGRTEAHPSS